LLKREIMIEVALRGTAIGQHRDAVLAHVGVVAVNRTQRFVAIPARIRRLTPRSSNSGDSDVA
jgi:hypothetical protein